MEIQSITTRANPTQESLAQTQIERNDEKYMKIALTVIRLIASSLADGIRAERCTPAICHVKQDKANKYNSQVRKHASWNGFILSTSFGRERMDLGWGGVGGG